ncbi:MULTISPECIES: hypothetical protein [Micromonospora]|uniref:hypothetical protein n=1 Tax=Micromonospora TaxID=1873 RepID=UPI001379299B|nr:MULTISPECIES: hypothetical protein [Micromonospora]MDG4750891.1 hypothetical protein [Micromonospora sp. WMMD718]UFN96870.1 hypothetical protein LF814_12395 [Micromonospora aurantiaca]
MAPSPTPVRAIHVDWTAPRLSQGDDRTSLHQSSPLGRLADAVLRLHGILAWRRLGPAGARAELVTDTAGAEEADRAGHLDWYDGYSTELDDLGELNLDPPRFFSAGKFYALSRTDTDTVVQDLDFYLRDRPPRPGPDDVTLTHDELREAAVYPKLSDLCQDLDCTNRFQPYDDVDTLPGNTSFLWAGSVAMARLIGRTSLDFCLAHPDSLPRWDGDSIGVLLWAEQWLTPALTLLNGGRVHRLTTSIWDTRISEWTDDAPRSEYYHHTWIQQKALAQQFPELRVAYCWYLLSDLMARCPGAIDTIDNMSLTSQERQLVDHVARVDDPTRMWLDVSAAQAFGK